VEDWEREVDSINWKTMLAEIDQALLDNLAAEIGFRSYENLENASGLVAEDYHICHLSDNRWAYWNPHTYTREDPLFFEDRDAVIEHIAEMFGLVDEKLEQLKLGMDQVHQSHQCEYCKYEFLPSTTTGDWDTNKYCSAECAMESVLHEMKEDFVE
jgi:ribosomal protein L37AE/L43A